MILRVKKLLMVLLAGVLALSMGIAIAMNMPMVKADGEATLSISMEDGLSVRTEDPIGIRFRAKVNKAYVNANQDNIEIVVMITPTRNLTGKTFDANFEGENKKIVFSKADGNLVDNGDYVVPGDETNYWYHACITNLQEQNIARNFSAISYVLYDGVLVEDSYTNIAKGNAWNSAKAYLEDDTVVKSDTDIENAEKLCASNVATINGFDGDTYALTVKRGQTVAQAANENEEAIKAALDVEGCAYFNTLPESANVTLAEDAEFDAIMNKLGFTEVDGGYEVNAGNIMFVQPEKIIVPETFNGKPVVAVGKLAFSSGNANSCIKYIKLPESVTLVKYHAFAECKALETLIMPGINISTYNPPADAGFHSDTRSAYLKHVVVGAGFAVVAFNGSNGRFLHPQLTSPEADIAPADPTNEIRQADIFVYGNTCGSIDVTNNTALKVYTNTRYGGQAYFYSATEKVGCWYYNEDGIPTLWEDKTVYELNAGQDGYVLTHFAEKDIVDGKAIIPDTYSMGGVELPVVAVGDYAFGAYKTLKYVKFPETVTKIGVDALAKLSNLETLIMPGIGGGLYSADRVFDSDIKSDVLKHVVASGTFNINSVDSSMPRFTNSHLAPPASNAAAADQENVYRTAEIYYVGTNANGKYNTVDATNNTAFIFKNPAADNRYCGCYYFYSETPAANGWYYNEDGIPTPYTGAAYVAVEGGYEVAMYLASGETTVEIPAMYNDQPIVSVGAGAFGNNATIETLILPESVTYIGTDALAGLTGLKTLVMPGITSTSNATFATSIKSTKLESITAGYGFQVVDAKLDCSGASNKAKIFLVNVPVDYDYKKVTVSAMTQYVKLISGEVYAYDATLDGYVMLANRVICETLIVSETLDDGVNGEKNVVKIGKWASYNASEGKLKTVILPETVTAIEYHAFVFHSAITTIVMPGVVGDGDQLFNYSAGSGLDSVKKVVINAEFGHTVWFGRGNQNVEIYVDGTEFNYSVAGNLGADFVYKVYLRSDTRLSGAWTYVDGIPTLWDNIAE